MSENRLPTSCPSCGHRLSVVRLGCAGCGTSVEGGYDLPVLSRLGSDDQELVLNFLKSSGSLKDLARLHSVSYPTMRNRLDALIDRVKSLEVGDGQEKEG